jgi:uncharacterized protein (DUF924 family)
MKHDYTISSYIFKLILDKVKAEFGVSQAKGARDVISRFGRHPHRNEILGRASTPEELEYLRTETPPHMRRPPS